VKNFHAFTLLELLLSLTLLIVLLGAIWSMVDMFSKAFTRGELRAERSQLVRSLSQILEEDLHAAIQDPTYPARGVSSEAEVLRRFGLVGTELSLRIDVVQINPFKTSDFPESQHTEVPELKTVYYDFTPMGRSTESGLLRREIDFETPVNTGAEVEIPELTGTGRPSLADALEEIESSQAAGQIAMPNGHLEQDHGKMLAPEVVRCRFSYFDGQNWMENWNSIEKNGLPAAIAVDLQLLPQQEIEAFLTSRDANILSRAVSQRIVVFVPTTSLKKQAELKRDQPPPEKISIQKPSRPERTSSQNRRPVPKPSTAPLKPQQERSLFR
jgi:hypothetical protein